MLQPPTPEEIDEALNLVREQCQRLRLMPMILVARDGKLKDITIPCTMNLTVEELEGYLKCLAAKFGRGLNPENVTHVLRNLDAN